MKCLLVNRTDLPQCPDTCVQVSLHSRLMISLTRFTWQSWDQIWWFLHCDTVVSDNNLDTDSDDGDDSDDGQDKTIKYVLWPCSAEDDKIWRKLLVTEPRSSHSDQYHQQYLSTPACAAVINQFVVSAAAGVNMMLDIILTVIFQTGMKIIDWVMRGRGLRSGGTETQLSSSYNLVVRNVWLMEILRLNLGTVLLEWDVVLFSRNL